MADETGQEGGATLDGLTRRLSHVYSRDAWVEISSRIPNAAAAEDVRSRPLSFSGMRMSELAFSRGRAGATRALPRPLCARATSVLWYLCCTQWSVQHSI